jgi:hypothetical protein
MGKLHGLHGRGKRVFKQRELAGAEFSQHMAGHVSRLAGTDPDLEPRETVGAEVLDDRFDAIVSTCGSFFAESQPAERQGDVVIN